MAAESRSQRQILVAFSAMMLATLLSALDQTIVATALPEIADDLQGFEDLSWVVSAYLLAATVTVPLYGKLSDLYGRRRRSRDRCWAGRSPTPRAGAGSSSSTCRWARSRWSSWSAR